jgi:16S rRNA A1518/A1519 N6-dimethyltransferase RsmA/KsgA/DIM1 with predicted DNA glycosylase/AP lyase activity
MSIKKMSEALKKLNKTYKEMHKKGHVESSNFSINKIFLEEQKITKKAKILEIGSGTGSMVSYLKKKDMMLLVLKFLMKD